MLSVFRLLTTIKKEKKKTKSHSVIVVAISLVMPNLRGIQRVILTTEIEMKMKIWADSYNSLYAILVLCLLAAGEYVWLRLFWKNIRDIQHNADSR